MHKRAIPEDELALQPATINHSPGREYHESARSWQGIPGIERAANGRLWAAWYSGGRTEDCNNHVLLVTSNDDGNSWSQPILVIDPSDHVRTADPVLWHDPTGRLWLFWMQTGTYGREVFDGRAGVWAIVSENSDSTNPVWSEPQRIANGVMMNKPTVLSTGEWLLCIAVWKPRPGAPPRRHLLEEEMFSKVYVSRDAGKSFQFLGRADVPKRTCDEHCIIERGDGSLWMLVRRVDGVGKAISHDRGATWQTEENFILPGPNSRFHIRRLHSGRLLLINHHQFTRRSRLTALLSDDDGDSWPHHLLLDERENVSYPDAIESPDGRIFIIYDRSRVGEGEILFQTITEDDILNKVDPGHTSGRLVVISSIQRMDIGSRKELFVDEALIDQKLNVTLTLHHPERREAALVTDLPWEGTLCNYVTVLRDGELLRMYYKAGDIREGQSTPENRTLHPAWICYAESRDGIHWDRPELGLFEFKGSKANNIVLKGFGDRDPGVGGFTPFLDTNPDCPSDERYKALGGLGVNCLLGGLYAMISADGIHWNLLQPDPVLRQREHGAFDSANVAFWDAPRGEYRIYFRDYLNRDSDSNNEELVKTRAIKTARSKNFIDWEDFAILEFPDVPLDQLYTNQIQPYPGAPHILVGFPTRYVQRPWSHSTETLPDPAHRAWRREIFFDRFGAALTDGLFMGGRDRKSFLRWNEPFLAPGPESQSRWFYGDNFQALGLFEVQTDTPCDADEISFLATENYGRPPGTVFRRFAIRKDGFVSVRADRKGGELTLVPLRFEGRSLHINFATSAAGSIRVQLEDWGGIAIPGFALNDCDEIIGNSLDRTVSWKGSQDVTALAGELIRMRFHLCEADLFSFKFC